MKFHRSLIALAAVMLLPAPRCMAQQERGTDASIHAAALEYDRVLAHEHARGLLDNDAALLVRLRGITSRLAAAARRIDPGTSRWAWELHTTDDASASAFCMAGGKILVGVPFVQRLVLGDADLAMLLAHEMAHALAHHRRPREDAIPDDPAEAVSFHAAAVAQEQEADEVGMRLAIQAGWPPGQLLVLFDKLAADVPAGTFSTTHPDASARVRHAREFASSLVQPEKK